MKEKIDPAAFLGVNIIGSIEQNKVLAGLIHRQTQYQGICQNNYQGGCNNQQGPIKQQDVRQQQQEIL